MQKQKIISCLGGIIICLGVGIFAGWVTKANVIDWYPTLKQPGFTPPPSVFAPVWTVLYILMGISAGLIFSINHPLKRKALIFFSIQLFLNGLWSFIFFGFHNLGLALLDLGLVLLFVLITLYYFFKIKPLCAMLLVPYVLWASFALMINAAVVYLN